MKNRIGIVGGGQLGRMLAFEAKRLGFTVTVLDSTPKSPAGQVADEQIIADFKDEKAIEKLAQVSDYLTFEIELANATILNKLADKGISINPSPKTLEIIKDKLKQKKFLSNAKIPVTQFQAVQTKEDILHSAKKFGLPLLLKARYDAYDGRGNFLIKTEKDIEEGLDKLKGRKLYVEKFVPFVKELAVMVARNTKGEIDVYPVVETVHQNNICHTVFAPALVSEQIKERAKMLTKKVMSKLSGAGVFGIEMFLTKSGRVYVNEIAPRVHNSGHYTIESCRTSQFEQHIRAITGLPLGKTNMISPAAVMVNILGDREGKAQVEGLSKAMSLSGIYVHIYGKEETRQERKMGHITAIDTTLSKAYKKAKLARKYISI